MRQTIPTTVASHAASAYPHQRKAVRLRVLPPLLPPADDPQPAPPHPHRRETVQMYAMRQRLQAESHSGSAHEDAPRRPAVLLPNAELQATVCDRARGEEAHRQPHEPARGESAAGGRLEDSPAAAASVRCGETRAVLPAVLRAAFPTVPGDEQRARVQAGRGPRAGAMLAGAVTRAATAVAPRAPCAPARDAPRPLCRGTSLQLSLDPHYGLETNCGVQNELSGGGARPVYDSRMRA